MKYALINCMFGFVCGELDLSKSSTLGPEFGFCMGEDPKYYDTEAEVLEAYGHLSLMQRLLIRPYAIDPRNELEIRGQKPSLIIQDEIMEAKK